MACDVLLVLAMPEHPSTNRHRVGPQGGTDTSVQMGQTTLGNIKNAVTGTYRAVQLKHLPRYLAEFEYRFNLAAMMPRLGWAAVRTPPITYNLLKLAEHHA